MVTNCTFRSNMASLGEGSAPGGDGGAAYFEASSVEISGSSFVNNTGELCNDLVCGSGLEEQ